VKERLLKLAPWIGFPVFYLVCLVLFASWTFPYETLKERIILSFNQQQRETNGQQELRIESLGSHWLSGVHAKGVHLVSPPTEVGKPPSDMKLDDVRARVSILGLLVGNRDVSFKVSAFGGTIDGDYDDHGKEKRIDADVDGVDIGQVAPITEALGVPLEGKLTAQVKLTLPDGKASKANGSVTLESADTAFGDGKAKIKGVPLALPRMNIGALTLAAEAKEGILRISKVVASGKDIELMGDGRVQLREVTSDSQCDVNLRFKVNDAYKTKNDVTKSLFGAAGPTNAGAMIDMDPKVKQSKRGDGFYGWHMRGQLGKPEFDPSPTAGPASGK
jgi:type II secretion system protein N